MSRSAGAPCQPASLSLSHSVTLRLSLSITLSPGRQVVIDDRFAIVDGGPHKAGMRSLAQAMVMQEGSRLCVALHKPWVALGHI